MRAAFLKKKFSAYLFRPIPVKISVLVHGRHIFRGLKLLMTFSQMITPLKELFSFRYDDRPMSEFVYGLHTYWIKLFHDYYFRVEHMGHVQEGLKVAKKERVILISNHAITIEAVFINYFLYIHRAGRVGTLVFPEAFKLPFIREFFRSTQCVPISVDHGTETLKNRHILLFPEGMDFINGMVNPHRVPRFHKGFLRIAKKYMEESHRKSVMIIPVGHVGIENALKFWVLRNRTFLELFVKPFASYPFMVVPKTPFLFPSKVVMNWGTPVKLTLQDLKNERKMTFWANHFRSELLSLRRTSHKVRDMSLF